MRSWCKDRIFSVFFRSPYLSAIGLLDLAGFEADLYQDPLRRLRLLLGLAPFGMCLATCRTSTSVSHLFPRQ